MLVWCLANSWCFAARDFGLPPGARCFRTGTRAYPSVVCKERATTREANRTAAPRVAPKMAWGFVALQSQIPADMLLRRASPQAILGAKIGRASCRERV